MDTDSGINDNRLKLDSIAHSSRGEQAHFLRNRIQMVSHIKAIFLCQRV